MKNFWKSFKNTFFIEHLRVTAPVCSFWELLFIEFLEWFAAS